MSKNQPPTETVHDVIHVWDLPTRLFHWGTVALVALAFATTDFIPLHAQVGYFLMALAFFRIGWGFWGNRYAKFSQFLKPRSEVKAYLQGFVTFSPPHSVGHNPAGGWMIVLLLVGTLFSVYSGLYTSEDGFVAPLARQGGAFGNLMGEVHEVSTSFLLTLIFLHVGGVVADWLMTGDKLIQAMITGDKEAKVVAEGADPVALSAPHSDMIDYAKAVGTMLLAIVLVWMIIR